MRTIWRALSTPGGDDCTTGGLREPLVREERDLPWLSLASLASEGRLIYCAGPPGTDIPSASTGRLDRLNCGHESGIPRSRRPALRSGTKQTAKQTVWAGEPHRLAALSRASTCFTPSSLPSSPGRAATV